MDDIQTFTVRYTEPERYTINTDSSLMNTMTFSNSNEWVFRINFKDKTFQLNKDYTVDDAAKLFWENVLRYAPQDYTIRKE